MTTRTSPVRERLLAGLPVAERRYEAAGVSTAVLEGGDGPPVVLLHGPGEFAADWIPVLPELVRDHRVIVPDLPGHGASLAGDGELTVGRVLHWLDELLARTCPQPPLLVGRLVGGAIAARYAAAQVAGPRRPLAGLVLVDSTGLAPFAPDPRFGLALHRHLAAPTERSFERLMEFCAFDMDRIRHRLGERWDLCAAYAVELARDPQVQSATAALIGQFAATAIPPEELAAIDVPTALIWGRNDMALPLAVGEAATARYGWPLHVVDEAGDDPPLDRPEAFMDALRAATGRTVAT
jgi:pimeloyl-ACP methyl ester carboxylesterase